jgi:uncharacterized membrane protein YkoI
MWRVLRPMIIAALAALFVTAAGHAGHPDCLEWSKAGPIIAQNSLLPANVIYQMVQKRLGGKIVNQSLCQVDGRFVYKLVVLGSTGEVTNLTVDALTGQF